MVIFFVFPVICNYKFNHLSLHLTLSRKDAKFLFYSYNLSAVAPWLGTCFR